MWGATSRFELMAAVAYPVSASASASVTKPPSRGAGVASRPAPRTPRPAPCWPGSNPVKSDACAGTDQGETVIACV